MENIWNVHNFLNIIAQLPAIIIAQHFAIIIAQHP